MADSCGTGAVHGVFVYGTLKRGFYNYFGTLGVLESSSCSRRVMFAGVAETCEEYLLHVGGPHWIPYLQKPVKGFKGRRIQGEVFYVDDETLRLLDEIEGVPTHYTRETIRVVIDGKERDCFLYVKAQFDESMARGPPLTSYDLNHHRVYIPPPLRSALEISKSTIPEEKKQRLAEFSKDTNMYIAKVGDLLRSCATEKKTLKILQVGTNSTSTTRALVGAASQEGTGRHLDITILGTLDDSACTELAPYENAVANDPALRSPCVALKRVDSHVFYLGSNFAIHSFDLIIATDVFQPPAPVNFCFKLRCHILRTLVAALSKDPHAQLDIHLTNSSTMSSDFDLVERCMDDLQLKRVEFGNVQDHQGKDSLMVALKRL